MRYQELIDSELLEKGAFVVVEMSVRQQENERFRIEQVTKWVYRPLAQFARSIRAALTQLVETIRRKGTRVQVADNLPSFRVNTTWVTQALYNLIANALKFHRPGEVPEIDLAPTG